jgi:hypothetical protein
METMCIPTQNALATNQQFTVMLKQLAVVYPINM